MLSNLNVRQGNSSSYNFPNSYDLHAGYGVATCGELLQGRIKDEYFLVNFPINNYSHIQVQQCIELGIHILSPGSYDKIINVLEHYLIYVGMTDIGLTVTVNTNIPRGKGMASSTSEITAALCATAKALGTPLTPDIISSLVIKIDPSDGIYYPGIIRYNPVTGHVYEYFGTPPSLNCLIVDIGGSINTKEYDRERAYAISVEFESETIRALKMMRTGFIQNSAALIASAATISSHCNQKILYRPIFKTLWDEVRSRGALGINCAHTGTIYGVLFDPAKTDKSKLQIGIESITGPLSILGYHRLIAGGV